MAQRDQHGGRSGCAVRSTMILALAGCGRIGFDPVADGPGGGIRQVSFGETGCPACVETYSGVTRDTSLHSATPQLNFGAFDQVKVDSNPPGVALLRFELSALPPSTQVVAAELHVYILADTANAGAVSQVFRVLESWDEGTGTSAGTIGAASWQERTAGVAWLAAGAAPPSRDTVVLGQLQPTMADTTYVIPFGPDGLQTIGDWIRDQTSNNGFELVLGSNGGWTFQSGESVHPRPVLVLSVSG